MTHLASRFFILCASVLLLSSGCGVDAIGDDAVRVTTSNSGVTILNTTSHVVYYVLIEAETATLVDLAPVSEWPTIEPGAQITIPYVGIMGYSETSTEAYFMWRIKKGPAGGSMTIEL
jgi:hypothetical protein